MSVEFDHIAISADRRDTGIEAFKSLSGAELPLGGEHPLMGTHNCVTAFGPDRFLELITINPDAPAPDHPRWFGLDDRAAGPLSAHAMILRSNDLDADLAIAKSHGVDLGEPMELSRGDLSWRFAVRKDGAIPLQGMAPLLMQWNAMPSHPASNMSQLGLELDSIAIQSPDADLLNTLFKNLGWADAPTATQGDARLTFTLRTPNGVVSL